LIAEAQASQTLVGAADVNLQVLDGVGFTWRDPAHWFVRRARTTSALLGTAEKNHALLAEQIGL
jgi:alkylation response protein AidB-like acyl-CoA dehydrogenase